MNQLQRILLTFSVVCVALATCCGIWAVWVEDREYAGKSFWSLAILFAGGLTASAVTGWFQTMGKATDQLATTILEKQNRKET